MTLSTSVSIQVFSYTLTNNNMDVLTIPASSTAAGFAANVAVTDSIELAADDVLVIQQGVPVATPYRFTLRYKES